mmetsp:Transcript_1721/g.3277  ORF Transcript_1721/g.3277 Transcript_1721/m.3277 type:complete len:235 (-) Transcript_1721:4147-4851(-)
MLVTPVHLGRLAITGKDGHLHLAVNLGVELVEVVGLVHGHRDELMLLLEARGKFLVTKRGGVEDDEELSLLHAVKCDGLKVVKVLAHLLVRNVFVVVQSKLEPKLLKTCAEIRIKCIIALDLGHLCALFNRGPDHSQIFVVLLLEHFVGDLLARNVAEAVIRRENVQAGPRTGRGQVSDVQALPQGGVVVGPDLGNLGEGQVVRLGGSCNPAEVVPCNLYLVLVDNPGGCDDGT